MTPYYDDGNGITFYLGDAREILPTIGLVDMFFTDPPYGHNNNNGDLIHRWRVALRMMARKRMIWSNGFLCKPPTCSRLEAAAAAAAAAADRTRNSLGGRSGSTNILISSKWWSGIKAQWAWDGTTDAVMKRCWSHRNQARRANGTTRRTRLKTSSGILAN